MNTQVTLREIAEEAGVSIVTVSRALNNKPDISKKTKAEILAIAKRLGYSPNMLAWSLRAKKTRSIGVIVTDIANPFFASVIRGIEEWAHEHEYSLILASSESNYEREAAAIRNMLYKRVDGLLIAPVKNQPGNVEFLLGSDVPFVLIARHFDDLDTSHVVIDDFQCGFQATEYLISKGHRRILFINGPSDSSSCAGRLAGYRAALARNGIPCENELIRETPDTLKNRAYRLMSDILETSLQFSATLAYNDLFAFEVIRALHQRQIGIPQDVAVVGIDGIDFGDLITPPLTTVDVPKEELGRRACGVLLREMERQGEEEPAQQVEGRSQREQVVLPPNRLIVRHSA